MGKCGKPVNLSYVEMQLIQNKNIVKLVPGSLKIKFYVWIIQNYLGKKCRLFVTVTLVLPSFLNKRPH